MEPKYVFKPMDTPVGKINLIASEKGLSAITWEDEDFSVVHLSNVIRDDNNPTLLETEKQLAEYFSKQRTAFELPLDFNGTKFQKSVWAAMLNIPYGETRTYGQIAEEIGNKSAVRAVGAAAGRNPISIIAPCHRVLGSSGKLTGFRGGFYNKCVLLDIEGNKDAEKDMKKLLDTKDIPGQLGIWEKPVLL